MSDLEQLQKNLNYKIKAQEIGLASWKGSHGTPQKMFIPTKDYLLNSASKIQDNVKIRNDMMEDYLQEQRTPLYRYDEYGNIILDDDGNPKEYKFHEVPPPDITLDPLRITFYLPSVDRVIDEELSPDAQKHLLENRDNLILENTTFISNRINDYKRDIERFDNEISDIETQLKQATEDLKMVYETPKLPNRKTLRKELNGTIKLLKKGRDERIIAITDLKEEINQLNINKDTFISDIDNVTAKIKNENKKNEAKINAYKEELNALNSGQLSTSKAFNETDEQYLERLQQLGDIPFADARTQIKALNREKDKLRENMKLIIRNNAVINQVVNSLYSNEPLLIYEINKFFNGFKEYFIKKFGSNNEKINFKEILHEISFYLKRATDPKVLSGNVINPSEIAQEVISNMPQNLIPYQQRRTTAPVSSSLNSPFSDEFGVSSADVVDEFQRFVDATDRGLRGMKPPGEEFLSGEEQIIGSESEEEEEEGKQIFHALLDDKKTLLFYTGNFKNNKNEGLGIYIKMSPMITIPKDQKYKNEDGVKVNLPTNYAYPNFFYSVKGTKNSFYMSRGLNIVNEISANLNIPLKQIYDFFGVKHFRNLTKNKLADLFIDLGLEETKEGFKVSKTNFELNKQPIIGWGVKHAQDIPDKVNFGSNILFLKKLFLKNILSIQNKHNTKINGFNNVIVSDNFVKIIMNLLKNIDFTNNDLQNLSNSERVLLDNLLTLSELNKKFVTGSNINSLNQLKKEYEILIGEIEAGNNNELLKKKLYTLLMKFVHFGALSQLQARKQYKEIIKDYF